MWELCTLFSFAGENAQRRVTLIPLASGAVEKGVVIEQLKRFEVKAARCYDPNEESRLRSVVQAIGTFTCVLSSGPRLGRVCCEDWVSVGAHDRAAQAPTLQHFVRRLSAQLPMLLENCLHPRAYLKT